MISNRNFLKRIILGVVTALIAATGFFSPIQALASDTTVHLRVALLPILDVLPFYVAEANGYFSGPGVKVMAMPVSSGLERDQLMQAGEIDAMLNEMTTTGFFNRDKIRVKILISARTASTEFPLFRLLSAPGSGIQYPAHLAGVPIGISKNTIIEYVTDRLLTANGLSPDRIIKKSVPSIPERYQLLIQGRLKAATLPDPLAKSAIEAGAVQVVDDSVFPQYSVSVLSFSVKAIKNKPEAIRFFLKAWDLAVEKINSNPDACRSILLRRIRIPENVREKYTIPLFPRATVPGADQWADVMKWMVEKSLLKESLLYESSVTTSFLSQNRVLKTD